MSLPRYPDYKDSGAEWLGEVPGHWEVMPFKWAIDRNDGGVWGDDPDGEDDTIVLRSTEQSVDGNWKIEDPAPRKLSEAENLFALLLEGDLLVTKSSGSSLHIGKTTLVTAEIAALKCCYSNFMQRIRTKHSFNPKFAWYVMNNDIARLQFDYLSNSTTGLANLNGTMVGQLLLTAPPLEEQQTIATFLDRETGKIDALIAEQRRLVELLSEKRQAVISHAVTKGLNPNTKMKDSGIEWLGEVPEHWGACALGYLATIQTGSTPDRSKPEYWEGEIPWLKTGEIKYELILNSEEQITEAGLQNSAAKIAEVGTLMMAMYGQGITRGRVAILGIRAAYNQACAAITPGSKLLNEYAKYFFMMAYQFIRDSGNETSQMNLGSGIIAKIKILIPTMEEQFSIAAFLDTETAKFYALTAEANRAIALLQEHRSALISAAVTGKIDVSKMVPERK